MFPIGQKVVIKSEHCTKLGEPALRLKQQAKVVGYGTVHDVDGVRPVYLVELEDALGTSEDCYISTLVCDPSVVFDA